MGQNHNNSESLDSDSLNILQEAIERGDSSAFAAALACVPEEERIPVLSFADGNGNNLFFWLLCQGRAQLLREVVSLCNVSELCRLTGPDEATCLHAAVGSGNAEMVSVLLSILPKDIGFSGIRSFLNQSTAGESGAFPKETVLHSAIRLRNVPILKLLLDQFLELREGETPRDVLEHLPWVFSNSSGQLVLDAALVSGDLKVVNLVLRAMDRCGTYSGQEGERLNYIWMCANSDDAMYRGNTALHSAVSTEDPEIVKAVVRYLSQSELCSLLSRCNLVFDTPLDSAARTGNVDLVRVLVKGLGKSYKKYVEQPFATVLRRRTERNDATSELPEGMPMRLVNNAVVSGNPDVLKVILSPLPLGLRYKLLTTAGWGYPFSPLQQVFLSGSTGCARVMLDSLLAPGRDPSYLLSALLKRSGGFTVMHCAASTELVKLVGCYGLEKEELAELLVAAGGTASGAPHIVPDGMNPLQSVMVGRKGNGSSVVGDPVALVRAMLSLLEGDPSLMQSVVSATDVKGRNTLHILASLVGSQGFTDTHYVSLLDDLSKSRVNVAALLQQRINGVQGTSPLEKMLQAERNLYTWSYRVNDHSSKLINEQRGMEEVTIPWEIVKRKTIMAFSAISIFLSISGIVIAFFVSVVPNFQKSGTLPDGVLASIIVLLLLFLSSVVLFVLYCPAKREIPQLSPLDNRPNCGFENLPLLCSSFEHGKVKMVESDRSGVRGHRDPARLVSVDPSSTEASSEHDSHSSPSSIVEEDSSRGGTVSALREETSLEGVFSAAPCLGSEEESYATALSSSLQCPVGEGDASSTVEGIAVEEVSRVSRSRSE